MKQIGIYMDEAVVDGYKAATEDPAAIKYLSKVRANAGYTELMRRVLENALPNIPHIIESIGE